MTKTTAKKITLTDPELSCLANIRKAGSFRSDSETIGEVLLFVQSLSERKGSLDLESLLIVLGKRFGIAGISDLADSKTVWVVYQRIENEGDNFYAVCRSEKIAGQARTMLAAKLGEVEKHFEISEIARDAIHPFGLLCQDGSKDVEG